MNLVFQVPIFEASQFVQADNGLHFCHAVVEPELLVFVVGHRYAGLRRPPAGPVHAGPIRPEQHAASAGGDRLVAVERQHGEATE